ncbi:MAG TPA: ATP-binding protein [Bacilli bacterium]|nr:ATP-binding protein [Bacilli bacterium]
MKSKRYVDPFFPNRPVTDPERFAGRESQVDNVVDSLYQTANDNPKHTIITGDRGMGKSSLLVQTRLLATGDNRLATQLGIELGMESFNFVVAWHDADEGQTPEHIAFGVLRELESSVKKFFQKFTLELDAFGLMISKAEEDEEKSISELVVQFCSKMEEISKEITKKENHGVLIFIDELDRVEASSGIATFFKLCAERLSRQGVNNVAFFCAGITGAIENLEADHGSIYRTFRDVPIPRLEPEESARILIGGFDKIKYTYDSKVLELTHEISNGFPEPVHIMGSGMLAVDTDGHISVDDFESAKLRVVSDLRRNKLHSLLKKAGSGKYQRILKIMAESTDPNVSVEFISNNLDWNKINLVQIWVTS